MKPNRETSVLDEPLVLVMRANPEPNDSGIRISAESPVIRTDSSGPVRSHSFELKRRMARIRLQRFEVQLSNGCRKFVETLAKTCVSRMAQRGSVLPRSEERRVGKE